MPYNLPSLISSQAITEPKASRWPIGAVDQRAIAGAHATGPGKPGGQWADRSDARFPGITNGSSFRK